MALPVASPSANEKDAVVDAATESGGPLQGVYVRPIGGPLRFCGDAFTIGLAIVPPVFEGVTTIRQTLEAVTIRNQFTSARTFGVKRHGEGHDTVGAWWSGQTLFIKSIALREPRFMVASPADGADVVHVTESYRKSGVARVEYTFTIDDPRKPNGVSSMRFSLVSTRVPYAAEEPAVASLTCE
jgi:hypothetical protein